MLLESKNQFRNLKPLESWLHPCVLLSSESYLRLLKEVILELYACGALNRFHHYPGTMVISCRSRKIRSQPPKCPSCANNSHLSGGTPEADTTGLRYTQ